MLVIAYLYNGLRTSCGRQGVAVARLRPDDMLAAVIAAVVVCADGAGHPCRKIPPRQFDRTAGKRLGRKTGQAEALGQRPAWRISTIEGLDGGCFRSHLHA